MNKKNQYTAPIIDVIMLSGDNSLLTGSEVVIDNETTTTEQFDRSDDCLWPDE